jgi:hypothetical protein
MAAEKDGSVPPSRTGVEGLAALNAHPVAARLRDRKLVRIAVVDDSFDPPSIANFKLGELAAFWDVLANDDKVGSFCKFFGAELESEEDITNEMLARLYENEGDLGEFQSAYDAVLREPLASKHKGLDRFMSVLTGDLGLEIRRHGSKAVLDDWAQLIFVDYYLGEHHDVSAIAASEGLTQRTLEGYPVGTEKPLIVLMSSDPGVMMRKDDYRDRTRVVEGMFYFVPKSDLSDQVMLFLDLDMMSGALAIGHRVQSFVDALDRGVRGRGNEIMAEFLAGVRRLSLDDYAFVQRLSLQQDGQPLGDYVVWLLAAYLGHLLFDVGLADSRRELNPLTFKEWPPSHTAPSKQLATMYHCALFDTTVGPLGKHPRWAGAADSEVSIDANTELTTRTAPIDAAGEEFSVESNDQPSGSEISDGTEVDPVSSMEVSTEAVTSVGAEASAPLEMSGGVVGAITGEENQVPGRDQLEARRQLPYLGLGDVFFRDGHSDVYLVINPECDLAFRHSDTFSGSRNGLAGTFYPGNADPPSIATMPASGSM